MGSSPLSRGILDVFTFFIQLCGIIPALAGNTALRPPCQARHHGSSPLSRGIRVLQLPAQYVHGIIPALAGNTQPQGSLRTSLQDHPRSRGEYSLYQLLNFVKSGSSPLSRGIPGHQILRLTGARIIPALAGNTLDSQRWICLSEDHPRSRGEYRGFRTTSVSLQGSSPLSRGIQRALKTVAQSVGIIPALAGNTGWE